MAREECDGCGTTIRIAGGIAGIWSFTQKPTGGMLLTFDDETEHFLCFACIEELPDHPRAADVGKIDSE